MDQDVVAEIVKRLDTAWQTRTLNILEKAVRHPETMPQDVGGGIDATLVLSGLLTLTTCRLELIEAFHNELVLEDE